MGRNIYFIFKSHLDIMIIKKRIAYFKAPFFFVKHSLLTLLVVVLLLSCSKSVPPQAVLSVFPSVGDSTLVFELNASESTDERAYEVALLFTQDLAIGFSFVDQSVLTAIHENVMLNTVRCIKNDE